MRRHMRDAIMGSPARCDETTQASVLADIDRFIERTTGVQTIIQMHGLVEIVRRYGLMDEDEVQSAAEYKAAYTDELRRGVQERLALLSSGLRSVDDYTIRGAVQFLEMLRSAGVRLYLASGTDQEDTRAEAQALGYADLFEEIRGSVDDVKNDPKRVVLSQIFAELETKSENALVFGDGPIEMLAGRRHGATTVGIVSDETRRYGWNPHKRARLVSGGAQLLVPDFIDRGRLGEALFGSHSHQEVDRDA